MLTLGFSLLTSNQESFFLILLEMRAKYNFRGSHLHFCLLLTLLE